MGTSLHDRSGHIDFDTTGSTPAQRIAARETCQVCRVIFTSDGQFRAERIAAPDSYANRRQADRAQYRTKGNLPESRSFDRPASEKQLSFLGKLTASRVTTPALDEELDAARAAWRTGTLTAARVSGLIDRLKERPWKDRGEAPAAPGAPTAPAPRKPWPQVAAGRYALDEPLQGYSNAINFFKVDRPTKGPFAGRTFVKLIASQTEHPVRGENARIVLEAIAEDPTAALRRYGQQLGHCGHCGRPLTDDESRAFGIGPICRGKLGL